MTEADAAYQQGYTRGYNLAKGGNMANIVPEPNTFKEARIRRYLREHYNLCRCGCADCQAEVAEAIVALLSPENSVEARKYAAKMVREQRKATTNWFLRKFHPVSVFGRHVGYRAELTTGEFSHLSNLE